MSEETEKKFERLYVALGKSVVLMQEEIYRLTAEKSILEAEKRLWIIDKESQARIIQQAITKSNETSNLYLEEIGRLKEEIARLKNGDKR